MSRGILNEKLKGIALAKRQVSTGITFLEKGSVEKNIDGKNTTAYVECPPIS